MEESSVIAQTLIINGIISAATAFGLLLTGALVMKLDRRTTDEEEPYLKSVE